jgi:hypothetical protein
MQSVPTFCSNYHDYNLKIVWFTKQKFDKNYFSHRTIEYKRPKRL